VSQLVWQEFECLETWMIPTVMFPNLLQSIKWNSSKPKWTQNQESITERH